MFLYIFVRKTPLFIKHILCIISFDSEHFDLLSKFFSKLIKEKFIRKENLKQICTDPRKVSNAIFWKLFFFRLLNLPQ